MFEPFRRLGSDRTESDRGAGLGLSIVRSVVQAHGGKLTVEPLSHGGLEVSVTLPTEAASSAGRSPNAGLALTALMVLFSTSV